MQKLKTLIKLNSMDFKTIIGWLTFFAGLAIIVFTLYSSYNIFTGKTPGPEFFKIEEKITSAPTIQKGKTPKSLEEIQQQLGQMISEQLKEIFPVGSLTKILNLIVWSILAGILVFGGSQISGLGIKLLKK
ncbi:MAG: hypothetical protein ACUVQ9_13660 [Thermodesulfobacteriota bacterium]